MCNAPIQQISIKKCIGNTSQESWSRRKSDISYLIVFGSIDHVYIPDERRTKQDDKNKTFIFIDYDNNSKGCKMYNPNNRKIVINRDVIFMEKENGILVLMLKTSTSFQLKKNEQITKE